MTKNTQLPDNQGKNVHRIEWIDVVKGIVIILMVFGHNIQFGSGKEILTEHLFYENNVYQFIYSFHMPCLMLISGYFFGFSVKKNNLLKKKTQTLLVPALVWSVIPAGIVFGKAVITRQLNVGIVIQCIQILVTYLWFLWAIIICTLLVLFVHRFCCNNSLIFILIGIVFLFIPDWLNSEMWKYMYPYFVVGYYWNLKKPKIKKIKKHKLIVTILLIAVFSVLLYFYNTDSFIYTTGITINSLQQIYIDFYRYVIGFVGSIMIIWIVYSVYPFIQKKTKIINRFLSYLGRISLSVYIIDCFLNSYVIPNLTKGFVFNYGIIFVETIAVLFICIIVDWIIKKIPFAKKLLLGSR